MLSDEAKEKHRLSQAKYRQKIGKERIKEYNKNYYDDKKVVRKQKDIPDKPITIKKIVETMEDTKPSFKTRKRLLEPSSIEDYIKKANILHKKLTDSDLPKTIKIELKKVFNDNSNINDELILNELTYINDDINKTIQRIRLLYINDNSFKTYLNILVVITSHLKTLDETIYQTLSKITTYTNNDIQYKRQDNILEEKDKDKIINLDKATIMSNIELIENIDDKLIFALYTLMPSRRLEWRLMTITNETNINKLKDSNYIIVSTNPKKVVFNIYKTYKTYEKQVFDITDKDLNDIIDRYIVINELKEGDYLFHLRRNKKEVIKESVFSLKISKIFELIYGVNISVRFIRMSWSNWINSQALSLNKKKRLIEMMGHSYNESQKYIKLI